MTKQQQSNRIESNRSICGRARENEVHALVAYVVGGFESPRIMLMQSFVFPRRVSVVTHAIRVIIVHIWVDDLHQPMIPFSLSPIVMYPYCLCRGVFAPL